MKVKKEEVSTFLTMVMEGQQGEAEVMLKKTPVLALVSGDGKDPSGRAFKSITGFQYAVLALDWQMWTMIRKYLPDEQAMEQTKGFSTGSWVKEHGEYVSWKDLLDNLKTYTDKFDSWSYEDATKHWLEKIGPFQKLLPQHVLQEYCQPERPFEPVPNFKSDYVLERKLPEWLVLSSLATKFSILRGRQSDVWRVSIQSALNVYMSMNFYFFNIF